MFESNPILLSVAASPWNLVMASALHLVSNFLYILLRSLTLVLIYAQRIAARLYEIQSIILELPPSGIYEPEESAIVVIGGDDNLGRRACLSFSELGYTVFALCRSHDEENNVHMSAPYPAKSPHASSKLLFEWQHRRKGSETSSWGLIVPIPVDMDSPSQRARASETVHAYCAGRSLHVVTVILTPPYATLHRWESRFRKNAAGLADHPVATAMNQGKLTKSLLWADLANRSMMEPILMVRDYVDTLAASSGRVIFILECSADSLFKPSPSPAHWAYSSITGCLSHELEALGVNVSSIFMDALAQHLDKPGQRLLADGRRDGREFLATSFQLIGQNILPAVLAAVSRSCAAQEDDVTKLLVQVVESRHPMRNLCVGSIHPFVCAAA